MFGAELSEVWQDYKPKKNKKKKDKPLTPDDMDSGMLLQARDKELITNERGGISGLFDDREIDYRYERVNPNVVTFENPYASRFEMKGRDKQYEKKEIPKAMTLEDDPDYNEFLEFKRNKMNKRPILNSKPKIFSKGNDIYSEGESNEQLNELILYIFTGFFLLILYDNIYRLGKKSY